MKTYLIKKQKQIIERIEKNANPSAHREMGAYIASVICLIVTTICHNTNVDEKLTMLINFGVCLIAFFTLEMIQKHLLEGTNKRKAILIDIKDYFFPTAILICIALPLIYNYW